jgi:hypothetical protein
MDSVRAIYHRRFEYSRCSIIAAKRNDAALGLKVMR